MFTDPTAYNPIEPTVPASDPYAPPYALNNPYEPTELYHSGVPLLPYPALPPMPPKRKHLLLTIVVVLTILVVLTSGLSMILFVRYQPLQVQKVPVNTPTSTQISQAQLPTPTQDAQMMIQSGDFPTFLEAFATLMANKDYTSLEKVTDTQNFQSLVLRADGGFSTWADTQSQLTTGNLGFLIHYPPITAEQEGYSCVGYGAQGLPQFNIHITAQDIKYVVGTALEPQQSMQTQPDGTVFIFEMPNTPGQRWLWRGYVLNNTANCQ